jgi:D-lyxose ketol-isomerase
MKRSEVLAAREEARQRLAAVGIALTDDEAANIEVADLGLDRLACEGLELVTYVNTDRYCAKELVLFPGQTCPEHRHPPVQGRAGKQETFRCRRGLVWLYVAGPPVSRIQAKVPEASQNYYTVFHEIEPARYLALVPGRPGWRRGLRVLEPQQ